MKNVDHNRIPDSIRVTLSEIHPLNLGPYSIGHYPLAVMRKSPTL